MTKGSDLAEARRSRGILQEEVAAEMGVTRQSVSSIEHRDSVRDGRAAQYLAALLRLTSQRTDASTDDITHSGG